jgi:dTDP-4-amino-4,6-dideoxygalactose transaminase
MKMIISSKNMIIEYENLSNVNLPYKEKFIRVFGEVLDAGWFILGKRVEKFEREFADYSGVDYCAGVASGFDALILAIRALDIPPASEIIVPSNTYIATILSIMQTGHKPVLVEPDITTYNINPALIESAITPKTRAIMVVHLYGKPCDMNPIINICGKHNLFLIEDCAQAHGAEYKGKKVGGFGDLAAFSFYPTKNLGCLGDGGAVLTNNKAYFEIVRKLRNYGSEKKYHFSNVGINSRLDEIQAAFLSIKLDALDSINSRKRAIAAMYLSRLNNNFILPKVDKDFYDVYHIFNIRHNRRDDLQNYLLKNEIKTDVHYPIPPHKQKALSFLAELKLPVSEEIHKTTLSLPVSTCHTDGEIDRVIGVLNNF